MGEEGREGGGRETGGCERRSQTARKDRRERGARAERSGLTEERGGREQANGDKDPAREREGGDDAMERVILSIPSRDPLSDVLGRRAAVGAGGGEAMLWPGENGRIMMGRIVMGS